MNEYKIYIGGSFRTTENPLPVVNPYDQKVFAQTWLADAAELEEAIQAGLAAEKEMASLPKGAVSILPMDRQAGNRLVTDPRIKMLSFTGSPAVGWKMKQEAGKKKVLLELGGNAGVIVSDTETEISVMTDEENAQRVQDWVNESVVQGTRIILGGKKKETYFEPTILTKTASRMKVCALEVFGPVVTLEKFVRFDEALDLINDSSYGLQAGVFTNRPDEMNHAFYRLKVGGVIVNDVPVFRVDHMPYGGVKDSGLGREGLKYAIREMMEPRLLVKNIL